MNFTHKIQNLDSTLSFLSYIALSPALIQETEGAMRELETVFRCQLHPVVAAAVQSWSLLLSITPPSRVPPLHTRYSETPKR